MRHAPAPGDKCQKGVSLWVSVRKVTGAVLGRQGHGRAGLFARALSGARRHNRCKALSEMSGVLACFAFSAVAAVRPELRGAPLPPCRHGGLASGFLDVRVAVFPAARVPPDGRLALPRGPRGTEPQLGHANCPRRWGQQRRGRDDGPGDCSSATRTSGLGARRGLDSSRSAGRSGRRPRDSVRPAGLIRTTPAGPKARRWGGQGARPGAFASACTICWAYGAVRRRD